MVTCEQRLEGHEGYLEEVMWISRGSFEAEGTAHKGPQGGACLICLRNNMEASVVGTEGGARGGNEDR